MPVTPLLSIEEARKAAGYPAGATNPRDDDLEAMVDAITPIIEDIVGPIAARTCDEWHDGGGSSVVLLYRPVLAVTTVTESWGNVRHTLTEQGLDGDDFDSYGYTVELRDGILTRRSSGTVSPFAPGRSNVHVVYSAGRTEVRANILGAARRLFKHLWQQENQGARPKMGTPEATMAQTPSGFAVPKVVIEMCADDVRAQGQA